jgi:hypothetical protein
VHPLVALIRTYLVDCANSHDESRYAEIMEPDFAIHVSGMTLAGRDTVYAGAVHDVYRKFPGFGVTTHEIRTNGDDLVLRFTEHGASAPHDGRLAAWAGIGLYRWNGERLAEAWVEQDFLSRSRQLSSGRPDPLEPPHLDPWIGADIAPSDPEAEAAAREWLLGDGWDAAPGFVLDDAWANPPSPLQLDGVTTHIDRLFSVGDRVAFHVQRQGTYAGAEVTLAAAGLVCVRDGRVVSGRAVTDRDGVRQRLKQLTPQEVV